MGIDRLSNGAPVRKALAAGIVAALGSQAADAAVFNVTNTDDAGPGSLRDALLAANGNMEADTIDLSAISGQTITLTSGALQTYYDDIIVNGAGVTIDADGNSQVLYSYYSNVTLNNLTITGGSGYYGGGIESKYGNLTLNDSVITGNSGVLGGGVNVFSYSGVTVNRTQITGNTAYYGGGIYAFSFYADLTVTDSVITGNSADFDNAPTSPARVRSAMSRMDQRFPGWRETPGGTLLGKGDEPIAGGGVLFAYMGDVIVSGTTIAGNDSGGSVGGIAALAFSGDVSIEASTVSGNQATNEGGGGVAVSKYEIRLRNSTISGNSAGGLGGGFAAYTVSGGQPDNGTQGQGGGAANLVLEFLTVTGNSSTTVGGGLALYALDALDIVGSTISGNTAPVDPDLMLLDPGQSADVAYTLIGVDPSTGTLNKDAASTALTGGNPLLGPLGDNGGPTFTHLPGNGSPLLDIIPPGDAGCGTTVTVDQRGEPRPTGPGCDVGALELTGAPPIGIPEARAVPVLDRVGLIVMTGLLGLLGLFGLRHRL